MNWAAVAFFATMAGSPVLLVIAGALRAKARYRATAPVEPVHPPTREMPTDLVNPDGLMDVVQSLRSMPPNRWPFEPSADDRAAGAVIRIPNDRKEV